MFICCKGEVKVYCWVLPLCGHLFLQCQCCLQAIVFLNFGIVDLVELLNLEGLKLIISLWMSASNVKR
jgi:hypothetical protein